MFKFALPTALIVALTFTTTWDAPAKAQATTQAGCAKQRDVYKNNLIEFNKGAELGRAMVQKHAKEQGGGTAPSAPLDKNDVRDPEKLAAAKYEACMAQVGKGGGTDEPGKAASPAAVVAKPAGPRVATESEVAECRAEAGKLGAVFTLDTTTRQMTERKPDEKDKNKFGRHIFDMCLSKKGVVAPPDAATTPVKATTGTGQPTPPTAGLNDQKNAPHLIPSAKPTVVREGAVKCNPASTCSGARSLCFKFCREYVKSTVCSTNCLSSHRLCMETGIWSTLKCEKTGMARQ